MSQLDVDRQVLRAVIAAYETDPVQILKEASTTNAIVRLLDNLGLDGHWFTFGPYLGWYMGPNQTHWTVVDMEDRALTQIGRQFDQALMLLVEGKREELVSLWEEVTASASSSARRPRSASGGPGGGRPAGARLRSGR